MRVPLRSHIYMVEERSDALSMIPYWVFIFFLFIFMTVSLVKGSVVPLVKPDGSGITKVRLGLQWDASQLGAQSDLDAFVVQKLPDGSKKIAYFGDRTAIAGVELSPDNRDGKTDGDDEYAIFNAGVTPDGEYILCVNIYDAVGRHQSFQGVANAKVVVYDADTKAAIAEYNMTADGGAHTGVVIGTLKDVGTNYLFTPKGDYVNGDINEIAAAL